MKGRGTRRWIVALGGAVSMTVLAAVAGQAWGQPAAKTATGSLAVLGSAEPPPVQSDQHAQNVNFARSLSAAFQSVAKKMEPSVVHITALRRVPLYEGGGFFSRPTGKTEMRPFSVGSGAIVTKDGYIITNNHVVANAEQINVRLPDGREVEGAKIVGRDEPTDLAVVKVNDNGLTPAEFADSDNLEVGEWVVAIGSPFGFQSTVTAGIVSAKGRSGIGLPGQSENNMLYQDFIQTDAAINPGNSGGPLLNLDGQIVGVNSAIASRAGGSEGIGFAIPSNMARAVMDSIIANGRVVRSWLGVNLADLQLADRQKQNVPSGEGVLVEEVIPDGPGDKGGLKSGDVILKFQGRAMDRRPQLRAAIALAPPGTKAQLDILRDGQAKTVTVELGDQVQGFAAANGGTAVADLGLTLKTLTGPQARKMGYNGIKGVVVLDVEPGTPGAGSELQPNDIIVAVGDRRVNDVDSFVKLLEGTDLSEGVELSVIRGNMRGSLVLQK